MAIISGIFNDPFGYPLANVTIKLTARSTTSATLSGTSAAAVTGKDGSYSMSVLTGLYAVSAIINRTDDYLGVIQVYPDSEDGTLNQFLNNFDPDDVTPDVIADLVVLVAAAIDAAKSAEDSAETAAKYAVVPRGTYDAGTEYAENDIVEAAGSEYRATAAVHGIAPPASPWELFLAAGEPGPANVLTIGTVTTVEPDVPSSATITGESPNQVLNLSLTQGKQGQPGKTGPANVLTVDGVTTLEPDQAARVEISGDSPAQSLKFYIPKGEEGNAGPANTLTIGTVTTVGPDEPSSATITGEAPNQVLSLSLTQGEKGDKGSGADVIQIAPGDTLDPLTAGVGTYYLSTGAILSNGPASGVTDIYSAAVQVRVPGVSVRLTVHAHFNETSGYNHCGDFELMESGTDLFWSKIGPGENSNPVAGKNFVMVDAGAGFAVVAMTSRDEFTTLIAGKVYGLLTEDEDTQLMKLTTAALDKLRIST